MTQRLPIPGHDNNTWGKILNGFLEVSLNADGTLNSAAVGTAGAALTTNNLSDLQSSSIARTNLGLGSAATQSSNAFQATGSYISRAGGTSSTVFVASYFNVMDYGATGDGSTNDTDAIQATITAAGTGTVYFPAGTYLLGAPLSISLACTFQGAGRDSSVLQLANGVNDYAIKYMQASSDFIVAAHFADFQINGNAINQTAGGGISSIGGVQCSFERLHLTNCFDWGVYLQGNGGGAFGHHNRLISCLFDNAAAAGIGGGVCATSCDENFYYGCDFEYLGGTTAPPGAGTYPVCLLDEAGLQQITSCCFVNSRAGDTNVIGVRVQNSSKTRIMGCTFDGLGGDNVFVSGSDCVIVGNEFSSIGQSGPAGAAAGVHLEYGNLRNTVTANSFISSSTNGQTGWLIYDQQEGNSGSNVIANNVLYALGTCSVAVIQTSGIGCIVRGNIGYNPVGHMSPPSIPTSGTALLNPFNVDSSVFIAGGTVTTVAIGGTSTGITSGQFFIPAGQSITLTYSAAPTWSWFGN